VSVVPPVAVDLAEHSLVFADTQLYKYADLRWVGNEAGHVEGENWNVVDRAGYLRWRPVESDTPLRKLHWFWHPNDEASVKGLDELMEDYTLTVGRGAQLLFNIPPDKDGLISELDTARTKSFGDEIRRRFGTAITAVLGVIFFFAIIGVFGLPAAIASLALYIAVAVLLVLRAHP